jgi:hypothetical protein
VSCGRRDHVLHVGKRPDHGAAEAVENVLDVEGDEAFVFGDQDVQVREIGRRSRIVARIVHAAPPGCSTAYNAKA